MVSFRFLGAWNSLYLNLTKECDCRKKFFQKSCAAWGGCLIGFWLWSLDTDIGRLFFTLGILLVVGAWISAARNTKKIKKKSKFQFNNVCLLHTQSRTVKKSQPGLIFILWSHYCSAPGYCTAAAHPVHGNPRTVPADPSGYTGCQ